MIKKYFNFISHLSLSLLPHNDDEVVRYDILGNTMIRMTFHNAHIYILFFQFLRVFVRDVFSIYICSRMFYDKLDIRICRISISSVVVAVVIHLVDLVFLPRIIPFVVILQFLHSLF